MANPGLDDYLEPIDERLANAIWILEERLDKYENYDGTIPQHVNIKNLRYAIEILEKHRE